MPTEDTRLTPSEELHSQWLIDEIKKQHPSEIFVPERWSQKMDWESVKKQTEHISVLVDFMFHHPMPWLLYNSYIDVLHTNLLVLRDIFFVNTGFYLDPRDSHKSIQAKEDFKKLRFWTLRDYEVTIRLADSFKKIYDESLKFLHGNPGAELRMDGIGEEWNELEEQLKGVESHYVHHRNVAKDLFQNTQSWSLLYAFAPYINRECGASASTTSSQSLYVGLMITGFYHLFTLLSNIFKIEIDNFQQLVQEFSQSEMGENFIRGWRNHMYLSREDFIKKLEEDKTLQRWVKPYCFVADGIHDLLWLFEKNDTSREIDFSLCSNINNWFRILTIAAVLQEYDKKHEKDDLKRKSHGGKSNSKPVRTFSEFVKDAQRTEEIMGKLHRLIGNKTNTEALKIITEAMWIDLLNRPTATSIKNEFATITCTPTVVSRCLNEPKPTRQIDIDKIKMKFENA